MDFINFLIALMPVVLVFLVRFIIKSSPISRDKIDEAQTELDNISKFNKKHFGEEVFYDAEEELIFDRIAAKGFILISLGVLMGFSIFLISRTIGLLNYSFSLVASSIFLISYGLAFSNRNKFFPFLIFLTFVLLLGLLICYFDQKDLIIANLQNIKVSSFVLIISFIFFLLIPRVEKYKDEDEN